jgi:sugar phosphate isomerase/epimerase
MSRLRLRWSLFPATYREYSIQQLAELVHGVGLDTVNAVVRDGYWVEPATLATSLPEFVKQMGREGIVVNRASTSYSAVELVRNPSVLPALREAGITEFRIGWFDKPRFGVRQALDEAAAAMDALARACEAAEIKAIYQVHHDKLIQSPSAAYQLVRGLPPKYIGVELDPGNQSFEGYEAPDYASELLGEYVAWFACKDTILKQTIPRSEEASKGWSRDFWPVFDGVVNWQNQLMALANIGFDGTAVLMPFYSRNDSRERTALLRQELDYLKALAESLGARPLGGIPRP